MMAECEGSFIALFRSKKFGESNDYIVLYRCLKKRKKEKSPPCTKVLCYTARGQKTVLKIPSDS